MGADGYLSNKLSVMGCRVPIFQEQIVFETDSNMTAQAGCWRFQLEKTYTSGRRQRAGVAE